MKNFTYLGDFPCSGLPCYARKLLVTGVAISTLCMSAQRAVAAKEFTLEEATIEDIHKGIRSGAITCKGLVEAYFERVKAYNGVCSTLITKDGADVPPAKGPLRGGAPQEFPTKTIPVSSIIPDLDKYQGLPLEYGRMETSASDADAELQMGMVAGISNAGHINAFETLNLRGERSVTCKGEFDAPPGKPLPENAPPGCESFRQLPDAIERAAELDEMYGRKPDLEKMPMYCAVINVKNWYDVKDVRSTGGNDVEFAMDVPLTEMTIVTELRNKGAIISGTTVASEVRFRADGENEVTTNYVGGNIVRATWGGTSCNPYDTTRTPGGSSGGSGSSVSTNMVTCSICETTGGSCRIPANANAVASFVTTKGLVSEEGSATADFINHRPGVLCRTLADAARVTDAMSNPKTGFFDSRDYFTAQPRSLFPSQPYASNIVTEKSLRKNSKPLQGMRIGLIREFMVKHVPNDETIVDLADKEFKSVLRDRLGADLVESVDSRYGDDPSVANMAYTFADAFAEILPGAAPEYFFEKDEDGSLVFSVPGHDVDSLDYLVKLSMGEAPLSPAINLRRLRDWIGDGGRDEFMIAQYLAQRGDAKIKNIDDYAQYSKWRSEDRKVGIENMVEANRQDSRVTDGPDRVKMHTLFRYVMMKVMLQNEIDVFVHPNITIPQGKTGYAQEPTQDGRRASGFGITDVLGVPEVIIPAGFTQIEYPPKFVLSEDQKSYDIVPGKASIKMDEPMPFSLEFWGGPGDEARVLKAASAYEVATKHRKPPKAFPALSNRK